MAQAAASEIVLCQAFQIRVLVGGQDRSRIMHRWVRLHLPLETRTFAFSSMSAKVIATAVRAKCGFCDCSSQGQRPRELSRAFLDFMAKRVQDRVRIMGFPDPPSPSRTIYQTAFKRGPLKTFESGAGNDFVMDLVAESTIGRQGAAICC